MPQLFEATRFVAMRNMSSNDQWKITTLAPERATVLHTPDPATISLRHPSLLALSSGKLLAAVSLHGSGVKGLSGAKGKHVHNSHWLQGQILISEDKGESWTTRGSYPFSDGTFFKDGPRMYLLGQRGNLQITCSTDGGQEWSKPANLTGTDTRGSRFLNGPGTAFHTGRYIYLVAMALTDKNHKGDPASVLTPVVLRGQAGKDLLQKRNWKITPHDLLFRDWISDERLNLLGIPTYTLTHPHGGENLARGRWANYPGWHMMVPVQINDPSHRWHDPREEIIHLLASVTTHKTNLTALLKVGEDENGTLKFSHQRTLAGTKETLLSTPGGHVPFALIQDDESGLYWLVSHQSTNSMSRIENLPPDQPGLPHDERHRLQLHFSKNLVDWSFAGLITSSDNPTTTYHSPSLAIRGKDLCLVCSTESKEDKKPPHTSRITFHSIPNFRELVY